MSTVAVVVPYLNTDVTRRLAWSWLARRYAALHPDWQVVAGRPSSSAWRKGEAVGNAIAQVAADVVIVADADSFVPLAELHAAVVAVLDGAPWVMPHRIVWRLSPRYTGLLLAHEPVDRPKQEWLRKRQYVTPIGGGMLVARRVDLLDVPLDTRFEGWGGEDIAWGWALDTLLGAHVSLDGDLFHLHHAPQLTRRKALWGTEVLAGRYAMANGDRDAMRALIDEQR